MAEVRGPLLADLFRRLLTDANGRVVVELVEDGEHDTEQILDLGVTANVRLTGHELRNLRSAVPGMRVEPTVG